MSGERLQDHWSSGFYRTTDNEGRNHRGVVVKLLALETRGLGFEPLLLQSFGCDFNRCQITLFKDTLFINCDEAGDYNVPKVSSC